MDPNVWAEVIKSAAQSVLGILALMILVVGLLALTFFRSATERIRLGIFVLLFAGVALFTISMLPKLRDEGPMAPAGATQTPSSAAASTPAIEGIWYAEIFYSWGVHEIEQFDFTVDGERLLGTASFGRAPRQIVDGRVSKGRLHFVTNLESTDGETRSYQYRGDLRESQIQFTLDNTGVRPTTFIAARSVEEARRVAPRLATGGKDPQLVGIEGGPYEPDYIREKIAQLHPDVRQCYIAAEFDPVDHAYMYYFIKIAKNGTVTETGAPGTDQRSVDLDRCMDHALRGVNWGAPSNGRAAEIKIEFEALPDWRSQ